MNAQEKLLKKFLHNYRSLTFTEIKKLLALYGFNMRKGRGSHVVFFHQDISKVIVVPVHNRECKAIYKKHIQKILIMYFI